MANRPLTRAEWMAALAEAVDNFDWSGAEERKWQGLTDEELREAYLAVSGNEWCLGGMSNAESFYEAIEAKLKEKNA